MSIAAGGVQNARRESLHADAPLAARGAVAIAAAVVLVAPLLPVGQHVLHLMILTFLYAAAAQSWNIMAGYSGQVSIGHATFFGVGAYAAGVLFEKFGISPWLGTVAGVVLSMLVAVLVGMTTLRLKGHYFAVATLIIGLSFQTIFARWDWVGGASGLYIPLDRAHPWISLQFHGSKVPYYYLAAALTALSIAIAALIDRSAFGFKLKAVRDDEEAAASLGIAVARYKVLAFVISAALMAVCGSFYAQYVLVLDPERVFSIELSTMVVLIAVMGGVGTTFGPLAGAAILVPLSEYTRILVGGTGSAFDQALYGLLMVAVCLWRPAGVLSLFYERVRRRRPQ